MCYLFMGPILWVWRCKHAVKQVSGTKGSNSADVEACATPTTPLMNPWAASGRKVSVGWCREGDARAGRGARGRDHRKSPLLDPITVSDPKAQLGASQVRTHHLTREAPRSPIWGFT